MSNIQNLKRKIDDIEENLKNLSTEKAKREGAIDTLTERLKKEFKAKDVKEADAILKELEGNLKVLNQEKDELEEEIDKILEENK